ncbi:Uncharacterized protein TCM_044984 [Theobroma cacao]|uniref:Uncharacterized protein n=1 Tax=Theobroma cacao TaxID=3641 RepID=A0A061FS62_THECC|nr:Uncharacterized protein TCM_044984 [Theobroma cacao]
MEQRSARFRGNLVTCKPPNPWVSSGFKHMNVNCGACKLRKILDGGRFIIAARHGWGHGLPYTYVDRPQDVMRSCDRLISPMLANIVETAMVFGSNVRRVNEFLFYHLLESKISLGFSNSYFYAW